GKYLNIKIFGDKRNSLNSNKTCDNTLNNNVNYIKRKKHNEKKKNDKNYDDKNYDDKNYDDKNHDDKNYDEEYIKKRKAKQGELLNNIDKNKIYRDKKIIHEGWLNKWTNIIGSYRPRYFILENGLLRYSLDKYSPTKESFVLTHCKIKVCPDDQLHFEIDSSEQGVLYLKANSPDDKHKWYISFKKAQLIYIHGNNHKTKKPHYNISDAVEGFNMSSNSLFLKNIIKNSTECIKREDQHLNDPIDIKNHTKNLLSNNNKEIIEKKNLDCLVNKNEEYIKDMEHNNIIKNMIYERNNTDMPYDIKDMHMPINKNYKSVSYCDNNNMSSYNEKNKNSSNINFKSNEYIFYKDDNIDKLSSSSSFDTPEFIEKMNSYNKKYNLEEVFISSTDFEDKTPTLCLMKNIISLKEMTRDVLKSSEYYQTKSILNNKIKNNNNNNNNNDGDNNNDDGDNNYNKNNNLQINSDELLSLLSQLCSSIQYAHIIIEKYIQCTEFLLKEESIHSKCMNQSLKLLAKQNYYLEKSHEINNLTHLEEEIKDKLKQFQLYHQCAVESEEEEEDKDIYPSKQQQQEDLFFDCDEFLYDKNISSNDVFEGESKNSISLYSSEGDKNEISHKIKNMKILNKKPDQNITNNNDNMLTTHSSNNTDEHMNYHIDEHMNDHIDEHVDDHIDEHVNDHIDEHVNDHIDEHFYNYINSDKENENIFSYQISDQKNLNIKNKSTCNDDNITTIEEEYTTDVCLKNKLNNKHSNETKRNTVSTEDDIAMGDVRESIIICDDNKKDHFVCDDNVEDKDIIRNQNENKNNNNNDNNDKNDIYIKDRNRNKTKHEDNNKNDNTSSDHHTCNNDTSDNNLKSVTFSLIPMCNSQNVKALNFKDIEIYTDKNIKRRKKLPSPRTEIKISMWSLLKDCIGKDLSRIGMPIYLNEPSSFLQRLAEDFQYIYLLKYASNEKESTSRLAFITAFTISPYASVIGRTYKPFNPLLGETYELTHRKFRFISEQVVHHPPITAYHCHNEYMENFASIITNVHILGKSVEVTMPGFSHLILKYKKTDMSNNNINDNNINDNNIDDNKMKEEKAESHFINSKNFGEQKKHMNDTDLNNHGMSNEMDLKSDGLKENENELLNDDMQREEKRNNCMSPLSEELYNKCKENPKNINQNNNNNNNNNNKMNVDNKNNHSCDDILYEKEHYTYERANMIIHNVIFGNLWVELHGNILIRNHNNGDFSIVKYIRKGWFEKDIHNVRGVVCDRYKNIIFFIYGKWSQEIFIAYVKDMKTLQYDNYFFNSDGSENTYHYNKNTLNDFINNIDWQLYENNIDNLNSICVWKAHKRPHNADQYYGFNYMTLELNEITKEYDKNKGAAIACTDSRFRPDQRNYENGNIDIAINEKLRLENKQRQNAKKFNNINKYQPKWFYKHKDPIFNDRDIYLFNNKYWRTKEKNQFSDTPDIF
ncbi:oxysterol-binding protein-related protein 2, putative, partial [Plasmodium sp. DRC-Itaito]